MKKFLCFLCFGILISPVLVQILCWILTIFFILIGIVNLVHGNYFLAVQQIIFMPLFLRVLAEVIIVLFKIEAGINKPRKLAKKKKSS